MKLAIRLVSLVVLAIVLAIAVDSYLSYRRQVALFDRDMRVYARLLGQYLRLVLVDERESEGMARVWKLIEEANEAEQRVRLRWVWLDASPGDPDTPRLPRETLGEVDNRARSHFEVREENGEDRLLSYVPLPLDPQRRGALEISQSLSGREDFTRRTIVRTVRLAGVTILLSGLLTSVLGVWMVGRPLHRLTEKARRIGRGDLDGPLPVRGRTELWSLARTMNEMCEQLAKAQAATNAEADARIAAVTQLRHSDRLKTVGTMASGVAHELGTPLNVVSGRASLIASGELSEDEIAESANIIRAQSARMTTVIRQLLGFSRSSAPVREVLDPRPLVERCAVLLSPIARKHGTTLRVQTAEVPVRVRANAAELQQVLANLIMNAVQAMPHGGEVEVGLRHEHVRPPQRHGGSKGEWICVWVQDEGTGIREEDVERIFEPFFTTKDVGEGTGLGLSVAYGIVRDHGGWIDVTTDANGSCFSVYLPQEHVVCCDGS